jgi:hypothetical protein
MDLVAVAAASAKRFATLTQKSKHSLGKPGRRASLSADFWISAVAITTRFDLEALKNPKSFARSRNVGTGLRFGQFKQLPGFAGAIQRIADYDHEVVEMTERAFRRPACRAA